MTTQDGIELVTLACDNCTAQIDVRSVQDVERVDARTITLTCPHCATRITHFWPGQANDPPTFARMKKASAE